MPFPKRPSLFARLSTLPRNGSAQYIGSPMPRHAMREAAQRGGGSKSLGRFQTLQMSIDLIQVRQSLRDSYRFLSLGGFGSFP